LRRCGFSYLALRNNPHANNLSFTQVFVFAYRNIVSKRSGTMKHIIASLTIGACLLLTSAGAVFAADQKTQVTGQPGAAFGGGLTCQDLPAGSTPGNAASANGSPFNPGNVTKHYAGNPGSPTAPVTSPVTGPGVPTVGGSSNANTFTAISEYDVACQNQAKK
jgi:hypothetical protein